MAKFRVQIIQFIIEVMTVEDVPHSTLYETIDRVAHSSTLPRGTLCAYAYLGWTPEPRTTGKYPVGEVVVYHSSTVPLVVNRI